ncbi:hypothetical protein BDV25DRAFT_145830 [Aspergillus avenaceus]|uniref:Uncharacterized protein n=1 Tax=Aspergillus avenaceus TaxID=36643 RepID=A0A5N6TCY7_ASPAV|nr:hypothetical protein BDV25DRAFT_145830 [Aspergillus avenaceus]
MPYWATIRTRNTLIPHDGDKRYQKKYTLFLQECLRILESGCTTAITIEEAKHFPDASDDESDETDFYETVTSAYETGSETDTDETSDETDSESAYGSNSEDVRKRSNRYTTDLPWEKNGEPGVEYALKQLREKALADLRNLDERCGGRIYTKPALGVR